MKDEKYLPHKWAIFNANGYLDYYDKRNNLEDSNLPFRIVDYSQDRRKGIDVTWKHIDATGAKSLNYGSDSYNPGYCGIFGIIFMSFFNEH